MGTSRHRGRPVISGRAMRRWWRSRRLLDARVRSALAEQLVNEIRHRVALEYALKQIKDHVWKSMSENHSDAVSGVTLVQFIQDVEDEIPIPEMGAGE